MRSTTLRAASSGTLCADEDIDTALIRKEIPDYAERTFYLSGPRSMVVAFEKQLFELGVPRRHILTDFFPGFA